MANTPMAAFRLSADDLDVLDAIVASGAAGNRTDAIRIATRHYLATTTTTTTTTPKAKKKPTK